MAHFIDCGTDGYVSLDHVARARWQRGDKDNRREIRQEIDVWIWAACGHNKEWIVAVNAALSAYYHPNRKRGEIGEDLLVRMLADLEAYGI
jgi:hypothetical protein